MPKNYTVDLSRRSERALEKLDKKDSATAQAITDWLDENIEGCSDPRAFGEPLKGKLKGFWKYRIGDYRIICDILDGRLIVLAIDIGHRKEIYRKTR